MIVEFVLYSFVSRYDCETNLLYFNVFLCFGLHFIQPCYVCHSCLHVVVKGEQRIVQQSTRINTSSGCGKERRILNVHGDLPRQHPFGTTLRFTGPVPADCERHRYANA